MSIHEIIINQEAPRSYRIYSITKKRRVPNPSTHVSSLEDKSQHNQALERSNERENDKIVRNDCVLVLRGT